jgi:four helix bundle protein
MRYERLEAFQACHTLALTVYRLTKSWPDHEKFGLISQTRRASFSAAVNIVEGSCRPGPAEFARFLGISVSSLGEVEYCLRFAKDLEYLEGDQLDEARKRLSAAGALTWKLYMAMARRARQRNPEPPRRRDVKTPETPRRLTPRRRDVKTPRRREKAATPAAEFRRSGDTRLRRGN